MKPMPPPVRRALLSVSDKTGLVELARSLAELDAHQGGSELATRARFAAKAFSHTARYDAAVAAYLSAQQAPPRQAFPATLSLLFEKVQDLRYGENPHQSAALYRDPAGRGAGVAAAQVLQGKDLSYNNIADADT